MRALIDTNVIVAALLTRHDDSATRRVLKAVFDGRIIPVVSVGVLEEYRNVLSRAKFAIKPDVATGICGYFRNHGEYVFPLGRTDIVLPDEKDRPFYEAALAIAEKGGYLVTGNAKHFPAEAHIVSPAAFCDIAGI